MADSDTISGIENLKSAVSGETPAYQYKDPNTDMMKAISKCIDAADGTIDDQYEYKNPNTDVIRKMDELATAISEGGGGGIEPSPELPEEYQRVEYLDFQGGYFSVNFPLTAIYNVIFSTSEESTTRSQGILGSRRSSTNRDTDFQVSIAEDLSEVAFWQRVLSDTTLVGATNISKDEKVSVWGTLTKYSSAYTYIGIYNPFDSGTNKYSKYEFYGKIYKTTGYTINSESGSILVPLCDFIPCYRKSDNQVGLYDVVTETFYTPTLLTYLSGTVTAGPDVN